MSENQEDQSAMAGTTRTKDKAVFLQYAIVVRLTNRKRSPDGLEPPQVEQWNKFWLALTSDEHWRATGFPQPIEIRPEDRYPDRPLMAPKDKPYNTKAARKILKALGFVDTTRPPRDFHIWMRWDYPDRERLERTMPGLVKAGIIRDVDYPVVVPSVEWVKYIEWEKYGVRAPEAETTLETEGVDGKQGDEDKGEEVSKVKGG